MNFTLVLQTHVHSERSHDSSVPISEYVKYLETHLLKNEYAFLGITDHNVIPIKMKDALNLSTDKVIVVPGIQWKLHKSFATALIKLCVRREIITLGDHDNLKRYILNNTSYSIFKNGEIDGNFYENEFLDYISRQNPIAIIIPHPRHLFIDYYGKKEIKILKQKINNKRIYHNFFVEEKTGYDPFPRLLFQYKNKYCILGGSDAHQIYGLFKTPALLSVETSINCDANIINQWKKANKTKSVVLYKKAITDIFNLLTKHNDKIVIKKHYIRSILCSLHSVPCFLKRRFTNFPKNLTR